VQYLQILNFITPLPIHFQLNLNTNTERVTSLIILTTNYYQTLRPDYDVQLNRKSKIADTIRYYLYLPGPTIQPSPTSLRYRLIYLMVIRYFLYRFPKTMLEKTIFGCIPVTAAICL